MKPETGNRYPLRAEPLRIGHYRRRAGWWPKKNGARLKNDWVEDTGEKQDGGCLLISRQPSACRFVLSISLARGNSVDFYLRVVRRVVRGIVHGVGVSDFNSPGQKTVPK